MLRRTPLERTGFTRKAPLRASLDSEVVLPQLRTAIVAVRARYGPAPAASPVPKFSYVRDERFRAMCRGLACQHCGLAGPDAGVTWAHSNQGKHGHGRSVKASDEFVAAMCWVCHRELDQGLLWSAAEKVAVWTAAYGGTVQGALAAGTWPAGFPVPPGFVS